MNKEQILKEFNEYAYNVEDQAGNKLIVIEQHQFDSLAERLSDVVSVPPEFKALLDISKDVLNEVMRAKIMFPSNFVNQHEAYAVILEEVDELWDEIKKNQKVYDLPAQRKEAVQACAMLFRLINELLPPNPEKE